MAQNATEKHCSMLLHWDRPRTASEVKDALEGADLHAKRHAMECVPPPPSP